MGAFQLDHPLVQLGFLSFSGLLCGRGMLAVGVGRMGRDDALPVAPRVWMNIRRVRLLRNRLLKPWVD